MFVCVWSRQSSMEVTRGFASSSDCGRHSELYSFLISITLLFGVFILPASADTGCSLTVLDLPFSEKLSNPCSLVDADSLHRDALTEEARESARRDVVDHMKARILQLKSAAEDILKEKALEGCTDLHLPLVASVPTAVTISRSTPLEVLRLFYTSLLKHTAYVYFMADQLERYSNGTCAHPELLNSTESLGSAMRNLVCNVRFSTVTIQNEGEENSFDGLTGKVFSEQLTDQSMCSRRSLRDCQTIRSTIAVLDGLANYLQTLQFDATTVLGEL